jgi:AcrR family transcriptional regulator
MPTRTPQRRTQAERREATRGAVLAAAVNCLQEEGHAGLTTRRIAERAGISQAGVRYCFPTRAELVAAAVAHLADQLADELQRQSSAPDVPERERLIAALDLLWEINNGPLFLAMLDLWSAARTDPELRDALDSASRSVMRIVTRTFAQLFPELATRPEARDLLDLANASMRGLAIFTSVDARGAQRHWRAVRRQIVALYDAL